MLLVSGVRNPHNKYHYEAESEKKTVDVKSIKDGDIIIANDCSYLSFLYLQSYFSPTYLIPTVDGVC